MISITYQIHRCVRKWSLQLGKTIGFKIEPQVLILICAVALFVVQLFLYLALSSKSIYCNLPNMRFYYQNSCYQQAKATSYAKLPTIYAITPTYARYVQRAELTRLSHTLMLVPNLHWIIVEDSDWRTNLVSKFIRRLKSEFDFHTVTHLVAQTPEDYKLKPGEPSWAHPKGVWQRNRGLDWIRENLIDLDEKGVIYFADDDNTYDLELFNEMRMTRKVSVWPVGFVGGLLVERPLIKDETKRVHAFNSRWRSERPFPIDMAGFAISMHLFVAHLDVKFSAEQKIGFIESHFLGQLVGSWDELEPRADKCTKVLVWHTKTQKPALHEERKLTKPSHSDLVDW